MKGGIVERAPAAPKPLGAKAVPQAKPLPLPVPLKSPNSESLPSKSVPNISRATNSQINNTESQLQYSENDELISSMSPEQIEEALREISSLLSKESINFLKEQRQLNSLDGAPDIKAAQSSDSESDDDVPELEQLAKGDARTEMVQHSSATSHVHEVELFDLDGKKVISKENAYIVVANAMVRQNSPFLKIDSSLQLSISEIILSQFSNELFLYLEDSQYVDFYSLDRVLEVGIRK